MGIDKKEIAERVLDQRGDDIADSNDVCYSKPNAGKVAIAKDKHIS